MTIALVVTLAASTQLPGRPAPVPAKQASHPGDVQDADEARPTVATQGEQQ
ncbi:MULTISPECIES: hypothetical protein [unclassified Streptomyces]|uniref:hypothetical protein n=1 Tax=Streptomyces sp. NPDC058441 TaxID=3346502 RepID=UPI003668B528